MNIINITNSCFKDMNESRLFDHSNRILNNMHHHMEYARKNHIYL